jgi:hypothetical protein
VDAAMQMLEDAHVTEDAFVALARDCHMIGGEGGTDESSDALRGKGRGGWEGGGEGREEGVEGDGRGGRGGGGGKGGGEGRGGGKGSDGGKTAPAFGSSLDWGIQGGRPIFCGRPSHDKSYSSCEGGSRAEANRKRGGGGGLTVEMISSCVFHAQIREQHRQEDRWLERKKKKYLESQDAEASTLIFDATAHLATAFDAADRKESLHASLGHGHLRSTIPIERAVSILQRLGAPYITVDLLLAKLQSVRVCGAEGHASKHTGMSPRPRTAICPETANLGSVCEFKDVSGAEVGRAEFLQVFGQFQDEERSVIFEQGVWLEGFQLKKQLIERPGFLSALVRLSLAFFISNRIPLLTSSPVTEAFSHCLRNLILPRGLHVPGVIFVSYGAKIRRAAASQGSVLPNAVAGIHGVSDGYEEGGAGSLGDGDRVVRLQKKVKRVKRGGCAKGKLREGATETHGEGKAIEGAVGEAVNARDATCLQASRPRTVPVREGGGGQSVSSESSEPESDSRDSSVPINCVKVSRAGGATRDEDGVECRSEARAGGLGLGRRGTGFYVPQGSSLDKSMEERNGSEWQHLGDAGEGSEREGSAVRGGGRRGDGQPAASELQSKSWKKGYSSERARFRALSAPVQLHPENKALEGGPGCKTDAQDTKLAKDSLTFANFA